MDHLHTPLPRGKQLLITTGSKKEARVEAATPERFARGKEGQKTTIMASRQDTHAGSPAQQDATFCRSSYPALNVLHIIVLFHPTF